MLIGVVALGRRRLGIPWEIPWVQIVALEIALFAAMGGLALAANYSLAESESGLGGGLIGWGVGALAGGVLGRWGGLAVLLGLVAAAIVVAARAPRVVSGKAPTERRDDRVEAEAEWLPEPEPLAALAAETETKAEARGATTRPGRSQDARSRPAARPSTSARTSGARWDATTPPAARLLDRSRPDERRPKDPADVRRDQRTLADFGVPARGRSSDRASTQLL
jgi:hypothetical protein